MQLGHCLFILIRGFKILRCFTYANQVFFFLYKKGAVVNSNEEGIMKRQLCKPCSVDNQEAEKLKPR